MRSRHGNGHQQSGAIESSIRNLGSDTAALGDDFRTFVADIEGLVKTSASLSGDELAQAREEIRQRIDTAKESLGVAGNQFVRRARRTIAATNEYVNDEPWKVIGFGTFVGVLIGVLLARR